MVKSREADIFSRPDKFSHYTGTFVAKPLRREGRLHCMYVRSMLFFALLFFCAMDDLRVNNYASVVRSSFDRV